MDLVAVLETMRWENFYVAHNKNEAEAKYKKKHQTITKKMSSLFHTNHPIATPLSRNYLSSPQVLSNCLYIVKDENIAMTTEEEAFPPLPRKLIKIQTV